MKGESSTMGMFEFEMFLQSKFTPEPEKTKKSKDQVKSQLENENIVKSETGQFKASDVD